MQRSILVCYLAAALIPGCAYQGVIVEKRFRPLPFSCSLGMDAIYNFQLRDSTGHIYSQMVTPDVFASYRVGDFFNDLAAPPSREGKELPGFRATPPEMNEGPYEPTRVMQMKPQHRAVVAAAVHSGRTSELPPVTAAATTKQAPKVATRAHHTSKSKSKIAKRHHRGKHSSKIAHRKHHSKKRAKIAAKHRRHHHQTLASVN
jgi:hypothetical protein